MQKTIRFVLVVSYFAIFAACTSLPTSVADSPQLEQNPSRIPNPTPNPTLTEVAQCNSQNLAQASELFTTNFREGRLEGIVFDEDVISGPIQFHPDGSSMATPVFSKSKPSLDGIYLFDILNGKLLCVLPDDHNGASFIGFAFSVKGDILASTHSDGTVVLRDPNTAAKILELKSRSYNTYYGWISFSRNDSIIATSGYFQPVRVWDSQSGRLIQEIASSDIQNTVSHAAISPDGDSLAFVHMGAGYSQVVSIPDSKLQVALKDSADERYLLYSNDGNFIYSLNNISEVTIWDVSTGNSIQTLNPYTKECSIQCGWGVETRITLSADGSRLLLEDPLKIILWNTQTWQELANGRDTDSYEYASIVDASLHPDGNMIAIIYDYMTIHFWYVTP